MKISAYHGLALELFKIGAVLDKDRSPTGQGFRLKLHETQPDAPLSPIYLNLRTSNNPKPGPLTPRIIGRIAQALWQCVLERRLTFDAVAGIPNAGDPIAQEFVRNTPGRQLIPRLIWLKKEEQDGKRRIAGVKGDAFLGVANRTLVIDDLITRADSKIEAIQALKTAKLTVRDVLVLVDHEQGGREQLEKAGYNLHSLFTLRELLEIYRDHNLITPTLHAEIASYLDANT